MNALSAIPLRPVAVPSTEENSSLWPFAPWSITIARDQKSKRFTPSRPFVKIGSHPTCDIRLSAKESPEFAYLLVSLQRDVEAWPLANMDRPVFGVISQEETIAIGSFRLTVSSNLSREPLEESQEFPQLELERAGQIKLTKLVRPVTIVGDDAPSLMRWRGVGLSPCHGAIISQSGKAWYLPLFADAGAVSSDSIQQIDFDNPVQVGQISVRRWRSTSPTQGSSVQAMRSSDNPSKSTTLRPSPVDTADSAASNPNLPVEVTDEVMRRMVELGRRRAMPYRLIWASVILGMAAISALVVYVVYKAMHDDLHRFL